MGTRSKLTPVYVRFTRFPSTVVVDVAGVNTIPVFWVVALIVGVKADNLESAKFMLLSYQVYIVFPEFPEKVLTNPEYEIVTADVVGLAPVGK
jgi:hypothetical protein